MTVHAAPTILTTMADEARLRVARDRGLVDDGLMRRWAEASDAPVSFPFEQALRADGLSFICEAKKASPSKGLIAPQFGYLPIARDYLAGGAAAMSVLTEPGHFLGADRYLAEITASVAIPVLRKDFTVDEYQIFQARALGASAMLVICAIVSDDELRRFLAVADDLGLSVLTEAHDATEIKRAIDAGARVIGVNNRNLHDFSVDRSTAERLRALVPSDRLFVSESGVMSVADAQEAAQLGADAVLVGEFLMRHSDRVGLLRQLRQATRPTTQGASGDGETRDPSQRHSKAPEPPTPARRRVMRPPQIKICGLCHEEDAAILNTLRPTYVGFVFHPASRRHVDPAQAARLRQALDPGIATVGVFHNADLSSVADLARDHVIDLIQLHGDEDATYVRELRQRLWHIPVIKAVRATSLEAIEQAASTRPDFLLVDGADPGSGARFDWRLLDTLARSGRVLPPLFLAGGLTPDNVRDACHHGPYAVDVSSGVEKDGHKDQALVAAFIEAVRSSVADTGRHRSSMGLNDSTP